MHDADRPAAPRIAASVDFRDRHGPFDVVGDVHGCYDELVELLGRLGYSVEEGAAVAGRGDGNLRVTPPAGRTLVFVGDLVDRGPKVVPTLRLAMGMHAAGTALVAPGNHDDKLRRKLLGRNVLVAHGLAGTLEELALEPTAFSERVLRFLSGLPPYLVLDGGRLVVAHAGLPAYAHGRDNRRARDLALYGETTGKLGPDGFPVRIRWGERYRGEALVVYGHTMVEAPEWLGNSVNIDTGVPFGGALTALRYPERETVSVPARRVYYGTRTPPGATSALDREEAGVSAAAAAVVDRRVDDARP